MSAAHLLWLLGCLPLGGAAGWAARRLSGGSDRLWLMPMALGGQTLLGLWALAAVPPPWWPVAFLLGWTLLTLALVDVMDFRLPDALTLPLAAAGLILSAGSEEWTRHAVGAVLGWGVPTALAAAYRRWRGRDGLGQGDAKLLAAAGAWLGWDALPSVLLIACAAAFSAIAIGQLRSSHSFRADIPIPFGPALCAGIWLQWLYGPLA